MNYYYSPSTGELIQTTNPAPWMGTTTIAPPIFDPATAGCFFQNGAWVIVSAAPAILAAAQVAQNAVLDQAYSAAIQLPVTYMATTFQADKSSQDVLSKTLVAGSLPTGFAWLDANNVAVPMTFAQLQGLAGAMLAQGYTAFTRLQTRKAAVRAATTVATVQSIAW